LPEGLKRAALLSALLGGAWLLSGTLSDSLFDSLSSIEVGPKPARGRTVFILLHGYGAPGSDLEGFAEELATALPQASFVIPEGPHRAGIGRSWIPSFSAPTRDEYIVRLNAEIAQTSALLWKVIERVKKKGARCEDIYLGGFSQGGRMAAEVALRAPANCKLGGLVVMSGGGMDDAELPTVPAASMRVLVTHGTNDQVVSLHVGQALAHKLKVDGHEVRWFEFEGAHQIPPVVRDGVATFLKGEDVGVAAQ
jgi:phospholipase/carboxylesterase